MKLKNFFKENYKFILFITFLLVFFYIPLPYYIMAPGGTINVTDRVEKEGYEVKDGSLNMLYVSEYDATPALLLFAKLRNEWDIEKNKERQISNESIDEIETRNKIMRDNSLDIAMLLAYKEAGKKIEITEKKNVVIATTKNNGLKVGDIILTADGAEVEDINTVKNIISKKEVGEFITFDILRNDTLTSVQSKIFIEENKKVIGTFIITEYEYDAEDEISIKFKDSESGSSGGMMLALTIYNAISDEDIIKGRNISGTGTIEPDGTIGEIDGVKYKIMGAVKDNMDLVLVSPSNYEEAIMIKDKYNYDIEIVEVSTLKEAIEYLKNN